MLKFSGRNIRVCFPSLWSYNWRSRYYNPSCFLLSALMWTLKLFCFFGVFLLYSVVPSLGRGLLCFVNTLLLVVCPYPPHFLMLLVSSVSSYPLHLQVCSVCPPWYWRESDLVWLLTSLGYHQLLLHEAAAFRKKRRKAVCQVCPSRDRLPSGLSLVNFPWTVSSLF